MAEFINNYFTNTGQIFLHEQKTGSARGKTKSATKNYQKKINVADDILQLKHRREDHNKKIAQKNQVLYQKIDDDFNFLIQKKKFQIEYQQQQPYKTSKDSKIFVCVRKRPIFQKELMDGEIDCISAINPKVYIYECKIKIDGYTKYIDTNEFKFDNAFNENDSTLLLYNCTIQPSLDILLRGGVVTCFAYGQTGSGKTYTMVGIQDIAINNIFQIFNDLGRRTNKIFTFYVSFFEIYLGLLYDLLNNRNKVQALEDKNQKVQIYGLTEQRVSSPDELKSIIDFANTVRTTHNTVTNETSSRSHAVCNFVIKTQNNNYEKEYAKLSLVDLAGSERATETQSNDKNRLAEGADINKSLLALKECIRALDSRKKGNVEQHVPFRNSKLTLVLRDSFLGKADLCKIIMISCVSPSNHSANHTINTLRYSMRLKEKVPNQGTNKNINMNIMVNNNYMKQIELKKRIMSNKNKIISSSPNIKRSSSKKGNKFRFIDKQNINKNNLNSYHTDANCSLEINQNKNKPKINSNKNISLKAQKPKNKKYNFNEQRSPNFKNNAFINYLDKNNSSQNNKKLSTKINSNNQNKPLQKKNFETKGQKLKNKYSAYVESKKRQLSINQSHSNKIKNISKPNLAKNKPINNTVIYPPNKIPNYQNKIPNYVMHKNIDLNIDIDPKQQYDDLLNDQLEEINSQQKYLTDDGNLISKFKGLTKDNEGKQIYKPVIENIIQSKMNYLNKLQDNIIEYKNLLNKYQ